VKTALVVVAAAACSGTPEQDHVEQGLTQCPNGVVEGVDVYSGQGTIDWAKANGAGIQFAFIKATQGDYNKQSTFVTNWQGSKAAGVIRSPYHFFDGTIDGVAQANAFLAEVTAGGGLEPGDLPAMLDIECPTSATQSQAQSNCEYTGNSGWVPTATLSQRIFDWLDTVQQATGRAPVLYSYPSWFQSVAFTDPKLATYPLYIASYNSCATIPQPWTEAIFWQYTATGTVAGISGEVDRDRFFGTAADLKGFTIQPPMSDAGITPDADTGGQPAGCGCNGGISPPYLGAIAFGLLLLVRRRSQRR
jgi:lysozyme